MDERGDALSVVLVDDDAAVRDSLRRFALDVLRPVGAALDRLPAEEVYGAASPYW